MTNFDITLTRRRVLAGILVIGLAAAAAGVGTFALFSDEETSSNNIDAGTLELDPVTGDLSYDGLYPTQSTGVQTISTTYQAGVDGDLTVDVSLNETQAGFADQLEVETAELTAGGTTVGSFSGSTLSDLSGQYPNVATLSDGDDITVDLNVTLASDTGNEYQGEGVNVAVTFNATQQN